MEKITKIKMWINENIPFLAQVYQNKYAGLLYDKFASLAPNQQKRAVFGSLAGVIFLALSYLLYNYATLWGMKNQMADQVAMTNLVLTYEKERGANPAQSGQMNRNSQLNNPGELKKYLMDSARVIGVSQKMVQIQETQDSAPENSGDNSAGKTAEYETRKAVVSLDKINLTQLKSYLQSIEYGIYSLNISSMKISNDERLRGYMKVELLVMAYLFGADEL